MCADWMRFHCEAWFHSKQNIHLLCDSGFKEHSEAKKKKPPKKRGSQIVQTEVNTKGNTSTEVIYLLQFNAGTELEKAQLWEAVSEGSEDRWALQRRNVDKSYLHGSRVLIQTQRDHHTAIKILYPWTDPHS